MFARVLGRALVTLLAAVLAMAVAVSASPAAPDSPAARPLPRPYTPAQLRRAFLGQGIDICTLTSLSGCAGIGAGSGAGGPRQITWFADVAEGSARYSITLVLDETPSLSATRSFPLLAYGGLPKGQAQARIGNLVVNVDRADSAPASQPRTTREFPAAVRQALAVLTGTRQTAAKQQRICRRLAAHPLPGVAPAPGGPCPILPAAADTDELIVAKLGRVGRSQATVRYRIYGSIVMAKRSWPRDADQQPSFAIGGPVPGLAVPSMRWLPLPPSPNQAAATVLVGQVLATVELDAPTGQHGDVKGAAALARRIAAYLETVESRS